MKVPDHEMRVSVRLVGLNEALIGRGSGAALMSSWDHELHFADPYLILKDNNIPTENHKRLQLICLCLSLQHLKWHELFVKLAGGPNVGRTFIMVLVKMSLAINSCRPQNDRDVSA